MPFDQSSTSLADVVTKLVALPTLRDTRRRDLISAVTRTATFLNRAPADLPTDAPALRLALATIHPAQAGISAKSLANVKANLATALRITRFMPRNLPKTEQTEAWTAFLQHASGDHQVHALSRFVNYCCSKGIDPDGVTDEVMLMFRAHIDARLIGTDPVKLCKEMAWTWNGIVKRNGLPLTTLTTTQNPQYRCRPLTDYPLTLQIEIEAYLKRRAVVDEFDTDGPDKALRPTSLRNTKAHLTQYCDALVNAGMDSTEITDLATVVSAAQMKTAFKSHIDRTGVPPKCGTLQNMAATLVVVARDHLGISSEHLTDILDVKKRVSINPKGMTAKNSQRLMKFNDWENVVRVVSLPHILMDRANASPKTRVAALNAMYAVAISILLSCPMRMANLASLDLDRHLMTSRTGKHTIYSIRIEGTEVKNHEAIEFRLNEGNSADLHRYLAQFRGSLTKAKSTALFPKATDGLPRAPGNLSAELSALIYRETGLKMHAHLFRHFAAKIYLDAHPGQYETVRRLLKHKTLQTTINFYAELTSQHAHDSYSETLAKFGGLS
jgi:integrase